MSIRTVIESRRKNRARMAKLRPELFEEWLELQRLKLDFEIVKEKLERAEKTWNNILIADDNEK
jgi:hypothetical protein